MSKYLLDSNVIINFLLGRKSAIFLLQDIKKIDPEPSTSPICIAEIQLGVKEIEIEKTNLFLDSLEIFDLTREVANLAGKYIRDYRNLGITLNFIDTLIAATCIVNCLVLITFNLKHYKISDLKLFNIEDY
jgi:predicted nucleic acid-binding protein